MCSLWIGPVPAAVLARCGWVCWVDRQGGVGPNGRDREMFQRFRSSDGTRQRISPCFLLRCGWAICRILTAFRKATASKPSLRQQDRRSKESSFQTSITEAHGNNYIRATNEKSAFLRAHCRVLRCGHPPTLIQPSPYR